MSSATVIISDTRTSLDHFLHLHIAVCVTSMPPFGLAYAWSQQRALEAAAKVSSAKAASASAGSAWTRGVAGVFDSGGGHRSAACENGQEVADHNFYYGGSVTAAVLAVGAVATVA